MGTREGCRWEVGRREGSESGRVLQVRVTGFADTLDLEQEERRKGTMSWSLHWAIDAIQGAERVHGSQGGMWEEPTNGLALAVRGSASPRLGFLEAEPERGVGASDSQRAGSQEVTPGVEEGRGLSWAGMRLQPVSPEPDPQGSLGMNVTVELSLVDAQRLGFCIPLIASRSLARVLTHPLKGIPSISG